MRALAGRLPAVLDGFSPETIALISVLGLILGTFPVVGCPTLLCLAAALAFRLNLPALLAVNQIVSPLQWALLIPLAHAGSRIIGAKTTWSVRAIALQAVIGWFCVCVPLGLSVYLPLVFALRQRRSNSRASAIVGWLPSGS